MGCETIADDVDDDDDGDDVNDGVHAYSYSP